MISESAAVYRGPACFDAVSGKLVGKAGVQFRFTSGRRTVKCCIQSGFAGIIPEDQGRDEGLCNVLIYFQKWSNCLHRETGGNNKKKDLLLLYGLLEYLQDAFLAGMLEGGERTPILNPVELEIGSMLVSYPLSLIGYQSQHWRLEWSKYYKRQKHWKPSLRLQQ
ncbi:Isocitrate lyase family [Musa troglodytarum]|uniref:Isocitrate lyase family n=1 Tax=Musa troglodytarum TaxID=320322 RepID=A0A9E7LA58_9LILI|nr:Isocitrate lyase family [Musa troglodytarum]